MNKPSSKKALNDTTTKPELGEAKPDLGNTTSPELGQAIGKAQPKVQNQTEDNYNVNIILDYDGKVDVLHLNNQDPKYKYRYLNTDLKNIAVKTSNVLGDRGGWQIVPKDHLTKVLGIAEQMISADGFYRVGADLVLARIPRDLYEKKEQYKKDKANKPMQQVNRMLKTGDPSLKGYGHDTIKGIQTKKELGDRWR